MAIVGEFWFLFITAMACNSYAEEFWFKLQLGHVLSGKSFCRLALRINWFMMSLQFSFFSSPAVWLREKHEISSILQASDRGDTVSFGFKRLKHHYAWLLLYRDSKALSFRKYV